MAGNTKKAAARTSAAKANSVAIPKNGKSYERLVADAALSPHMTNAYTAKTFAQGAFGQLEGKLELSEFVKALEVQVDAVQAGSLRGVEAMLTAQAASLNSIFTELARRAAINMGEHMPAMETYMRLALKAQSQCRTTLEALSAIKNPPVVFAKQANIANGPQQVNNGIPANASPVHAREEKPIQSNELLTDGVEHGSTLDIRGTAAAGGVDQELATVGAIDRPAHG